MGRGGVHGFYMCAGVLLLLCAPDTRHTPAPLRAEPYMSRSSDRKIIIVHLRIPHTGYGVAKYKPGTPHLWFSPAV